MSVVDGGRTRPLRAVLFLFASAAMWAAALALAALYSPHGRRRTTPPPPALAPAAMGLPQGSTVLLANMFGRQEVAIVADADEKALFAVDVLRHTVTGRTPLDGTPAQLLITREGTLLVALRDRARVAVLDPTEDGTFRERASIATRDEPFGLAEAPDGMVLVTCAAGHALQGFDGLALRFTVDLPREPRAVYVSPRFRRAYVAHVTGPLLSVVDLASPERGFATFGVVSSPIAAEQGLLVPDPVQGYALAGFDGMVVAPHARTVTGDFTRRTRSEYGGEEVVSLMPHATVTAVVLDGPSPRVWFGPDGRCVLPRAAVFAAGGALLLACADDVNVERLSGPIAPPGRTRSFNVPWATTEWHVGAGISGLAYDPRMRIAVAWAQEDRVLGVRDYVADTPFPGQVIPVPHSFEPNAAAQAIGRGRRLFHSCDERIGGGLHACASCHPDGLDDGLTWPTPDGPRQTPTLRGRLDGTAPYGWLGRRKSLESHIVQTIHRLGGKGLDAQARGDLAQYLLAMRAPARAMPEAAADVARGQALFVDACAYCHQPASGFTDGERHDVTSRAKGDVSAAFDTPSLRFVGTTSPYFHDGRYENLRALLVDSEGTMWSASRAFSTTDFAALEAYLRTL
jgi:cytochrome c553